MYSEKGTDYGACGVVAILLLTGGNVLDIASC